MRKYVAFLRGINVGGHHKVPMADLKSEFERMNFKNVTTILNSGNVLFESDTKNSIDKITKKLEAVFGFPISTSIIPFEIILKMVEDNPFENLKITKDTRLYVSFLKEDTGSNLSLPWTNEDGSFQILEKRGKVIFSCLDLSLSGTPKAMETLEKNYGKETTTRNWNIIEKIRKKASAQKWI